MTDHPLTDEMCESICQNCNTWKSQNKIWFESMRAAYDLAIEKVEKSVERKIKVLRRSRYAYGANAIEDFFEFIMEEMRPQENNKND